MKIDIFNIDTFIKENHCLEVTDPSFFDSSGNPRDNSLFSYTIFGMSDYERKNRFGYVDLVGNDTKTHYLHPLVYLVISRLGSLKNVVNGTKYAIIENRKVVLIPDDKIENFPDAETGIEFLYDNWEKINWLSLDEEEEIDSIDKKSRLKFLKIIKKDEAFVTKWLVMPPFYREQSSGTKALGDSINELYKSLISKSSALKNGGRFSFFGNDSKFKIQLLLVQIYQETIKVIKGKNSLLRKHLIGKTIDYTASNVITSPQISASESVEEMPVKFGYGRFPLPTLLSLFLPFYVNELVSFFNTILIPSLYEISRVTGGKIDPSEFNTEAAERLIKLFIKAPTERFMPIQFKIEFEEKTQIREFKILEAKSESDIKEGKWIKRPMTLADIFALVSPDLLSDKHVYVTRYPVTNIKNIYPSKIEIATTTRTRTVWLNYNPYMENKFVKVTNYPYIKWEGNPDPKPDLFYNFIEVLVCGNAYLSALNGDYDGDMLYMKPVFSKEANAEAEKLIYAKSNFISANGSNIRGASNIGKDSLISLFEFTKD